MIQNLSKRVPTYIVLAFFLEILREKTTPLLHGTLSTPVWVQRGMKQGRLESMDVLCFTLVKQLLELATTWKQMGYERNLYEDDLEAWMAIVSYQLASTSTRMKVPK